MCHILTNHHMLLKLLVRVVTTLILCSVITLAHLGAFAKFAKNIYYLRHVCLSVCPHEQLVSTQHASS
jgi:hypothetical protein